MGGTSLLACSCNGIEAAPVDVQVLIASGMAAFSIVGLPDKAVAESRERIRAALHAVGLALPAKRITVNLSPADLPKEGSHYDLPIALALLAAMGALPPEFAARHVSMGELALDGGIAPVSGVLPAAMAALGEGRGLVCPAANGPEAAWAGEELEIVAAATLVQVVNHAKGLQPLPRPQPAAAVQTGERPDLRDVRGQESAKRALEVAAAGGHHLLMNGPPGAGKSMLAARLPSILPPMSPREMLETSIIHSLAGMLPGGAVSGALDSLDSAVGSLGDFAGGVARGAFDTAASAVDAVGASQRNALRYGTDSLDSVLEFGGDIIDSQQRQLTNTLASINAANATTAQLEGVNAVKSAGLISSTVRDSVKYLALAGAVYALARYLKG